MGKTGWKRLLSAFLCVCMVAVMAPTAFAAGEDAVSTSEELVQAIAAANDGDTIMLGEGTFTTYNTTSPRKKLTFVGAGSDQTVWKIGNIPAQDKDGEYNSDYSFDGCDTITFKNMKMVNGIKDYMGFVRISNLNFENCVFEGRGSYWGYQTTKFTNCTFNAPENDYALWDYSSPVMTFDGCTFNVSGKTVNVYASDASDTVRKVVMTGCTVNSTKTNKAVLNIKNANQAWDVEISNTKATGLTEDATTGSNLYQVETTGSAGKALTVSVDGKTVWKNGAPAVEVAEVNGVKYTSLAEAVAAAKDGDTVKLLKNASTSTLKSGVTYDLNGKTLTYTSGMTVTNTDAPTSFIDTSVSGAARGGTLKMTRTARGGAAFTVSAGTTFNAQNICIESTRCEGIFPQGKDATLNITNCDMKANWYCVGTNAGSLANYGVIINLQGSTFSSMGTYAVDGTAVYINVSGELNIDDCELTAPRQALMVRAGTANITNSTLKTTGSYSDKEQYYTGKWGSGNEVPAAALVVGNYVNGAADAYVADAVVTVENTKLIGENDFPALYVDGNTKYKSDVSISGDKMTVSGAVMKGQNQDNAVISISGGMFTSDPSDYCADNLTGVPSGNTTYPWAVGTKSATKADIAVGAPTVNEPDVSYAEGSKEKTLLDNAQTALMTTAPAVTGTGVETAASAAANKNTVTANDEVVTKLNNQMNGTSATKVNTNIVIQTYMDITITGVDATENKQSISVEIQPMYRTVATTADVNNGDEIVLKADGAQTVNAVQIGQPQKLDVQAGYPVEVTIPLPTGFVTANLKVKHEKNGKLVGYHDATRNTADNTITFINDKGFSTFTVLSDARSTTIQFTDKDGSNIGSAKSYGPSNVNDALPTTAAESGYVFNGWKFEGVDGVYTTLTDELLTKLAAKGGTVSATPDFSKRSSGGSSSGKTTYKVTTSAVNNGGVNASPSSAEKGAAITITLSPDKGYKLDKLTVTDGSGKTISTTRKSDTVYTFTMPASAVKVSVSYVKDDSAVEPTTGFSDVAATAWYANAVKYAVDKGMMNGVGGNKFAPDGVTNRGMIVTVLYRLENEPTAAAASFTDVASGAYYANAVAWASANGIVTGYGNGKFGPNDSITREQFAAILYRYAQYKKYDVSVGEDTNILSYNDAQSISAYAIPAIQWACGAGVMNGSNGRLTPKLGATRAQAAQLLMNFCENAAK